MLIFNFDQVELALALRASVSLGCPIRDALEAIYVLAPIDICTVPDLRDLQANRALLLLLLILGNSIHRASVSLVATRVTGHLFYTFGLSVTLVTLMTALVKPFSLIFFESSRVVDLLLIILHFIASQYL